MSEVETSSPAVETTQAPAESSSTEATQTTEQTETTQNDTPVVPAYTPNFKFKAYDKEHEIDELFRPLIKDSETEKKIKSYLEKAYGLDDMKPKYQKVRQDYESYKKETDPVLKGVNTLTQMLNRGDYDNFFNSVGIKKEALYKYVLNQLNLQEMSPEQRSEHEQNVAMRQQNMLLEQQAQQFQEHYEQISVQNRTFELNTVLDRPDVKTIQTAFEDKHGPGSFKQAVVDHGFKVWKAEGKDLTADQAVSEFTRYIAPFLQMSQQAPQQTMQQPGKPPVIPNIGGRSASPVKQAPKSIADLKKMADQFGS